MKKTIPILVALLLTTICYAQNVVDLRAKDYFPSDKGTTETEYNYVKKGYKTQIEQGLDMKKGYTFKELHTNFYGTYKMKFKGLYRDGQTYPCAILIVMEYDGDVDYVCIPHHESEKKIWEMYANYVISLGERSKALSWGIAKSAAFFAQNN